MSKPKRNLNRVTIYLYRAFDIAVVLRVEKVGCWNAWIDVHRYCLLDPGGESPGSITKVCVDSYLYRAHIVVVSRTDHDRRVLGVICREPVVGHAYTAADLAFETSSAELGAVLMIVYRVNLERILNWRGQIPHIEW